MSIGTNIKEYRKKAGLTQQQLSKDIGVNRVTITKYENDSINPPLKKLEDIAAALNCKVYELLGEEAPKPGEVIQIKTVGGLVKEVNRLTGKNASDAVKQVEVDADYFQRLAVPALKLNEIGRKVLLDNAESLAANEDMTK